MSFVSALSILLLDNGQWSAYIMYVLYLYVSVLKLLLFDQRKENIARGKMPNQSLVTRMLLKDHFIVGIVFHTHRAEHCNSKTNNG
jgi:hypothetical protein